MVQQLLEQVKGNWAVAAGLLALIGSLATVSVQIGLYERSVQINTGRLDILERQMLESREADARLSERIARLEAGRRDR